ncbi:MAG: chromosomal replication initiator protein DnaA [Bacteroidaceae bacterium]|nr:chromosomal replication initiator protein DnaA [Bacteroidaceae bacterium]
MEKNPKVLWSNCLEIIRENVTEKQFLTWFAPTTFDSYDEKTNKLTIFVPSRFVYEFLEEHYVQLLSFSITRVFGEKAKLSYRILEDQEHKLTTVVPANDKTPFVQQHNIKDANKAPNIMQAAKPQDLDPRLNPKYSFDNFIEGVSNKLTRSVAENVATHPGSTAFNPLFIYGTSGVGKTHLVNAIGTRIKELYPTKRVLYVSAHLFYIQFVDATRSNRINDFINFYQTIDVLIIDDIQEISGYDKTQNVFFHIFNHLHQNGKQIIMTSDRSPIEMTDVADRLLTRFKWGMLAEMERPNIELRRDILHDKIQKDGLNFPEQVIDYIAENVNESVRDLEGIVTSMMAHATVLNHEIDIQLAESVVRRVVKTTAEKKPLTIDEIVKKVCDFYKVSKEDIATKSRKKNFVQARQVSMYLAQKYTGSSLSVIGKFIGKRDHATVLYACNQVQDRINIDNAFKEDIERITNGLRKEGGTN